MQSSSSVAWPANRDILGYSRWVVFAAAFLAIAVISPYEYAWSSMSEHIGGRYHWSHTEIGWMFTLFVIFESVGTLPGGILRDKFGLRWVTVVGGLVAGVGIFATSLGPSYPFLLAIWCIGSFFAEFIYNTTVTTANKWFPDMRGVAAGLIAGAFSWGSLPFIFPIRAIAKTAPDAEFFHIIYIMAAIIGGVTIVTSLFMKDPPAGMAHSEILFVLSAILALFFWGRLFSLFPAIIGHYFGEAAAGSNYGTVYAIAKGSGGFYGGVLWAVLISEHGFPFAMGVAGVMAIVAGLLIVPLKYRPPVWRQAADAMPAL